MKEVSLLLGTLCKLLPTQAASEPSDGLITVDQVGKYFSLNKKIFILLVGKKEFSKKLFV